MMDTNTDTVSRLSEQLVEFYDKISSWEHSVVKGTGLSPSQMHTIEVIGHRQDMRMKELAARLAITTGTLTVAIDKLEKKELVQRKPHQHDRRSWLVALTPRGQEVFAQHHRFHAEFTAEISGSLSGEEIGQFSSMMEKLLARM